MEYINELKDVFDNQNTVFSVIFGSARNKTLENVNDIDVLTIVKNKEIPYNRKELQILSNETKKEIDLTYMEESVLDFRLENLDYLYDTILTESKFLTGDPDIYHQKQENIKKAKVTDNSVLFHRLEALKALDSALLSWDNFNFYERHEAISQLPENHNDKTLFQQICDDIINRRHTTTHHEPYTSSSVKELHSAISSCEYVFSYLSAADWLKKYQRPVFLADILSSNGKRENTFKKCHEYKKSCERQKDKIETQKVKAFIEDASIECRKEFCPSELYMV